MRQPGTIVFVVAMTCLATAPLWAQPKGPSAAVSATPPAPPAAGSSGVSLLELVVSSGAEGWTIIALSVVAVALIVDYSRLLRRAVLLPPGLADRVREALQGGQLAAAQQACQGQPSLLASVVTAGLVELDGGWTLVEKTMEDSLADQAARLGRRIDYLSMIANIAPMLGLLGTVRGMVLAFQKVAETQGVARAADLAGGIYLALVTTVLGLIVAIPALAIYALFRSRLDQFVSEVAGAAHHAFAPLRRARPAAVPRAMPKPPPVEGR